MEFIEKIEALAKKIRQQGNCIATEEATKNAFVLPFLSSILGYDVFDPTEVIPEYTADTGIKKGEKVDYAILQDSNVQILVECKKYGEALGEKHSGQLYRYFSVTNARIGILTNGAQYAFYTDLEAANKMDPTPFLILDLENIDENILPEVEKLSKSAFDIESVIGAAEELKYISQIKKIFAEQLTEPEEDFIKFFAAKTYNRMLTPRIKESFRAITLRALQQYMNDAVNARLKSAISPTPELTGQIQSSITPLSNTSGEMESAETKIQTTQDEIEGFQVVKAILRKHFDVQRIFGRDTQSYFGILLDNNNRKPLCRLHFNSKQKYLGILDAAKNEKRIPITTIDDIYQYADLLIESVQIYHDDAPDHAA